MLDVPAGALGLPRAVDPGHHVVVAKTATAEGRQELDVREGEQKQVELALVPTGRPVVEPPLATPQEPTGPSKTSALPDLVTWIGVGLAGAGVIVGSVTGVMAMSKRSGARRASARITCAGRRRTRTSPRPT